MPRIVKPEMVVEFIHEVSGYIPAIRQNLKGWSVDQSRMDLIGEAHRLVHSIKGSASMMGFSPLSHIAFYVEEALEELASGQLEWSTAADLIHLTVNTIATCAEGIGSGRPCEKQLAPEVVSGFRRLRGLDPAGDAAELAALLGEGGRQADQAEPEPPANILPQDILIGFRQEAEEYLQQAGEALRSLETAPANLAILQQVRRPVHALKGASGVVGLADASRLAQRLQFALDHMMEEHAGVTGEIINLFYSTLDALGDLTAGKEPGIALPDLMANYDSLVGHNQAAPPAPAAASKPGVAAAWLLSPQEEAEPDLVAMFRPEAEELVARIAESLRAFQNSPGERALIQELRRAVHTLKGGAAMIGMESVSSLSHRMEDLLDAMWDGRAAAAPEIEELLFTTADCLSDLVAVTSRTEEFRQKVGSLYARYEALIGPEPLPVLRPAAAQNPAEQPEVEEAAPKAEAFSPDQLFVRVPIDRLDNVMRVVSELVVARSVFEQYLADYEHDINDMRLSVGRLNRVSGRFDDEFEVAALDSGLGRVNVRAVPIGAIPAGRDYDSKSGFDTLEFDRYTNLHLISRDISETTADVNSATGEMGNRIRDFRSFLERLAGLTGEVQDKLMRMRMVPFSGLGTRLHRTVRVTAQKCGKQAELHLEGQRIELETTVLEKIAGPLEHLLRNAVDHGIESSAMRTVLSKPPRGRISIRTHNEGTQVVIQVADDGAGIDPAVIKERGVRMGLISEQEAETMSDSDALQLVFAPGFSTAEQVSEISGRGVGMDIVRATVLELKGSVSLFSEPGEGTRLTIRLPMALAVLRVLMVKVAGHSYAIPLSAVSQVLHLEASRFEKIGQDKVLPLAGSVVPAKRLEDILGLKKVVETGDAQSLPVVVLNVGSQQLAALVDEVMEAREVVLKNLGNFLRRVPCILGGTTMGDGSVVLIVNPNELLEAREDSGFSAAARRSKGSAARALDVLIVDDSVSVRRVVANLIKSAGWNATTAKDGVEALETLQSQERLPDVILLDIEMPRMDGYELTATLRKMERFRELPIVMLTSRAGEKHRQRAYEIGATDYLVKPYQDETLLSVVRRLAREAREAPVG